MFASYVLSAIRALQRDPWHAAVNILGLAVALAAGLLIALYLRHEFSYEDFITEPDRIYRVEADYVAPDQSVFHQIEAPQPLVEALTSDLGEQITATRLQRRGNVVLETERSKSRPRIYVGDEHLFDVLDIAVAEGDAAAAMAEPGALLLSRRTARELFGTEAVIGEPLRVNGADLHVAAILEDPPTNTDRPIDILGNFATPAFYPRESPVSHWLRTTAEILVRLKGATPSEAVVSQLPGVIARHRPTDLGGEMTLSLRPLREVHLMANPADGAPNRNVIVIGALAATGAFLIFIACFSYINLATARSLLRLKEVGLRKIMGGRSSQLALQFLIESALVTLIAFALAFSAAAISLPVFGNLVGRAFSLADLMRPGFIASAVALLAFVALAAGGYPALALAARKPVDLVRAKRSDGGKLLRTGIVSLQFGLTSALMIAATIAFAQLAYVRSMDLGFDKGGLLVMSMALDQTTDGRDLILRDRLAESPAFTGATWSVGAPGSPWHDDISLSRPGDAPGAAPRDVANLFIDARFFDVYRVELLAGRAFSDDLGLDRFSFPTPDRPSRSNAVLSEAAALQLGFRSPQEAVGQELSSDYSGGQVDFTVVGVVSDFHYDLGRAERQPTMFLPRLDRPAQGEVTVRVRPGAEADAVAEAQRIWSEIFPGESPRYFFIEDRIDLLNAEEDRQSKLFGFFAGMALFVACLGLFALASFVAARRAFEVAVRKVLGATTLGVTRLLMWDFAKPVLLANVIAWPLAYALISPWLERFPYRIELSPTYFVGVSTLSLVVAMGTVLIRTWKTARTRPALVLRTE